MAALAVTTMVAVTCVVEARVAVEAEASVMVRVVTPITTAVKPGIGPVSAGPSRRRRRPTWPKMRSHLFC
jgi:hypothetical protein